MERNEQGISGDCTVLEQYVKTVLPITISVNYIYLITLWFSRHKIFGSFAEIHFSLDSASHLTKRQELKAFQSLSMLYLANEEASFLALFTPKSSPKSLHPPCVLWCSE